MKKTTVERKTSETEIQLELRLDGKGKTEIRTGIPFFDHMLEQMARHGLMDLSLRAQGDLDVDYHHTVEDVGICLGQAFRNVVGDARGIRRFGHAQIPMDESLVSVAIDISGRPFLVFRAPDQSGRIGSFPFGLVPEFFRSLSQHAGITLHIHVLEGGELHHTVEAAFKAFGRAFLEASAKDDRVADVPSTKGSLV